MIVEITSAELHVGDVLYLQEDEESPCDCVVLYSSNPNGICYIQVHASLLIHPRLQTSTAKRT